MRLGLCSKQLMTVYRRYKLRKFGIRRALIVEFPAMGSVLLKHQMLMHLMLIAEWNALTDCATNLRCLRSSGSPQPPLHRGPIFK